MPQKISISKAVLSRPVMIFLGPDGAFGYARLGTRRHAALVKQESLLPVASVARLQEGAALQIRLCKKAYDSSLYKYPLPEGKSQLGIEDLIPIGAEIEREYQELHAQEKAAMAAGGTEEQESSEEQLSGAGSESC